MEVEEQYAPAGHKGQGVIRLASSEKVPASQWSGEGRPVSLQKYPAGHGVMLRALDGQKVPTGQSVPLDPGGLQ